MQAVQFLEICLPKSSKKLLSLLTPKNLAPTRECKVSPSRLTPFLCTWTSAKILMVTLASVSLPRASVAISREFDVVVVVRLADANSRLALVRSTASSGDCGEGKHTSMSESVVKKLFQSLMSGFKICLVALEVKRDPKKSQRNSYYGHAEHGHRRLGPEAFSYTAAHHHH